MKLLLSLDDERTFTLKFEQQSNYPVDLYFLLDLSFGITRESARENLIKMGAEISKYSILKSYFILDFY